MTQTIKEDIKILKKIHKEIENSYNLHEWVLSEEFENELLRITGMDDISDFDDENLAYYIDGMQRTLTLIILRG